MARTTKVRTLRPSSHHESASSAFLALEDLALEGSLLSSAAAAGFRWRTSESAILACFCLKIVDTRGNDSKFSRFKKEAKEDVSTQRKATDNKG